MNKRWLVKTNWFAPFRKGDVIVKAGRENYYSKEGSKISDRLPCKFFIAKGSWFEEIVEKPELPTIPWRKWSRDEALNAKDNFYFVAILNDGRRLTGECLPSAGFISLFYGNDDVENIVHYCRIADLPAPRDDV